MKDDASERDEEEEEPPIKLYLRLPARAIPPTPPLLVYTHTHTHIPSRLIFLLPPSPDIVKPRKKSQ